MVEPRDSVTVHVPAAGKLPNSTLPVGIANVGCVIVPTVGASGLALTVI